MSESTLTRSALRSPLMWIFIVILAAGLGWWYMGATKKDAPKGPPAGMTPSTPVRVEAARKQDLDITCGDSVR